MKMLVDMNVMICSVRRVARISRARQRRKMTVVVKRGMSLARREERAHLLSLGGWELAVVDS